MRKVFITGGAGFVGSRVVRRFLKDGDQVMIFDSFKQYLMPDPKTEQPNLLGRLADIIEKIEVVQGDTMNRDHLRRTLNRFQPDIVIHMAALPLASVAVEQTEDAFQSILASTVNMLEIVRDFTHKCRFLYISSSMVYGDFKADKVPEDHPTDPKEIYGSFKLCGEVIVRGYMKCHKLDTAIVRPSAVYGPYDANQRVIQRFIRRALKGEALRIDGDGSMKLDFTFVDDTAEGIYLVATRKESMGETFNVTRGEAQSLSEVVEEIRKHVPGLKVEYGPVPSYMPRRGTLDISKAGRLVGYKPQYGLSKGIEEYVAHLRKNII